MINFIDGRGLEAKCRQLAAEGLRLGPARIYCELRSRFGPQLDVIFEGVCASGGPAIAPSVPVIGAQEPLAPGTTAPGTTPAQETWFHRMLCSPGLRSGLEGLAATSIGNPVMRSRVQAALSAVEIYCSGGVITRRAVFDAVCAVTSLPGVRERIAALGPTGVVLATALTAACALGPALADSPQLPASLAPVAQLPGFSTRVRRRSAVPVQQLSDRVRRLVAARDPREMMMRCLPYVGLQELTGLLASSSSSSADEAMNADVFVQALLATAVQNAETQGDVAYLLGGDASASADDEVLTPELRNDLISAVVGMV